MKVLTAKDIADALNLTRVTNFKLTEILSFLQKGWEITYIGGNTTIHFKRGW